MITEKIWHQLGPQHHLPLLSFNHTPTDSLSQGSATTPPHCLQHMGNTASSTVDTGNGNVCESILVSSSG